MSRKVEFRQDSTGKFGWIRFIGVGRDRERVFSASDADASETQLQARPGCNLCRLTLAHTVERCAAETAGSSS